MARAERDHSAQSPRKFPQIKIGGWVRARIASEPRKIATPLNRPHDPLPQRRHLPEAFLTDSRLGAGGVKNMVARGLVRRCSL
jgi:hypothetical protein